MDETETSRKKKFETKTQDLKILESAKSKLREFVRDRDFET